MNKVLVLGHKGMLGNCIHKYLVSQGVEVITTDLRWPQIEFQRFLQEFDYQIINAIGAIWQKTNNFEINYKLSGFLSAVARGKVIHFSSDCEDDDTDYGKSKRLATERILNSDQVTKIIKTSIIGIEEKTNYSFLSWALEQKGEIEGWVGAEWNGNTSLTVAKLVLNMLTEWEDYDKFTCISSENNNKYELLKTIKKIWELEYEVKRVEKGENRMLCGILQADIETQLRELKEFYEKYQPSSL